jgi:hypothetical protein
MMFCKSMIVLFSNSKVSQKGRANKKEIEIWGIQVVLLPDDDASADVSIVWEIVT